MKTHLYCWEDSLGTVWYVGKTRQNPNKRMRQHIACSQCKKRKWQYSVHKWLRTQLSKKLRPVFRVIETVTGKGNTQEKAWIYHYRCLNGSLCNDTAGGDGVKTVIMTDALKRKISQSCKGKKVSRQTCLRISKALSGRKLSKDHCRKISEVKSGMQHSVEHCKKIADSLRGRKLSKRHISNIRKCKTGLSLTESVRKKISKSNKQTKSTKEWRAKQSKALKLFWAKRKGQYDPDSRPKKRSKA